MKIPFDIKYRPQIESGEYKVITRAGEEVKIICWERRCTLYPIVCLYGDFDTLLSLNYKGKVFFERRKHDNDLFIVTPEKEKEENK